jgi:hypothetical protein
VFSNLTHFANLAHSALVLGVIFGAIKCTLLIRCSTVDWGVAGSTNLKLGELIKLNVNRIVRVSLTLSLGLFGLSSCQRLVIFLKGRDDTVKPRL